ncbi:MAG: deoxyribodipyrimidine photo-lyase [Acholeplasmataceae bacterium]|jgi:deoxyribodipyrimidine photo-lyase|nr:deoxyribodipyrimidine photo-lyase [Acholeplasmataceae bacterium]
MNKLRVTTLQNKVDTSGDYVIYWMSQSQRVHYNHALKRAIEIANQMNLPLIVFFGLTKGYPEANKRHYQFMLEGLKEVEVLLKKLHISFVLRICSPNVGLRAFLQQSAYLVMDVGYLKHQVYWREDVVDYIQKNGFSIGVDLVETDVIVPVKIASDHEEYGAYTLRPKLMKLYPSYRDYSSLPVIMNQKELPIESESLDDIISILTKLDLDDNIKPSPIYRGGYLQASKLLSLFIEHKANLYDESNDPSKDLTSKMSMYLHFGQISSLEILERMFLAQSQGQIDGKAFDQYLEQLFIRRELAFNFVTYNKGYDQFEHITENWAYQTMREHQQDHRTHIYRIDDYITFNTHDVYFNAAMVEMVKTGYMHNYMRMYWAKKIIEWSPNYKQAFETIKYLNNTYFIDGRDPNSYAGIAWCFGKHDRAWTNREIFGKLRYMNAAGLERKFDIQTYVVNMQKYL